MYPLIVLALRAIDLSAHAHCGARCKSGGVAVVLQLSGDHQIDSLTVRVTAVEALQVGTIELNDVFPVAQEISTEPRLSQMAAMAAGETSAIAPEMIAEHQFFAMTIPPREWMDEMTRCQGQRVISPDI
jgi:hypothetical protein